MKGLTEFTPFNRVEMDRHELGKVLREVISIYQEYKHVHGNSRKQAIENAITEVLDGMDAARELQLMGEDAAPNLKFSL